MEAGKSMELDRSDMEPLQPNLDSGQHVAARFLRVLLGELPNS